MCSRVDSLSGFRDTLGERFRGARRGRVTGSPGTAKPPFSAVDCSARNSVALGEGQNGHTVRKIRSEPGPFFGGQARAGKPLAAPGQHVAEVVPVASGGEVFHPNAAPNVTRVTKDRAIGDSPAGEPPRDVVSLFNLLADPEVTVAVSATGAGEEPAAFAALHLFPEAECYSLQQLATAMLPG